LDYRGPKRILLQPENAFGISCFRSRDLIVQEFDSKGNLWASRGMILYQLKKGDDKFIRIAHVPSGFSFFWLNNFRVFRRLTLKPAIIETIVTGDGKICTLSAGYIWYGEVNGKKFKKTIKLSHYGFGVGRGILSNGLLLINDKLSFFGEYFRNKERTYVRIYKSKDTEQTWDIAYEFKPGTIRHIHALQADPYTGKLWICTGDKDNESMIGWSDDDYKNIVPIGQGSQIWRTCQLVFTKEAVYWGSDTGSIDLAGIYRWDKDMAKLTRLRHIKGGILFGTRLAKGTIVLSTDREGFPNEIDKKTRLFLINKNDKISHIECGTWNYTKRGYRYSFATLRFQRNQGFSSLAVSVLNQKEFPDGDLLLFPEENLISPKESD
jgi:hypothetical protein